MKTGLLGGTLAVSPRSDLEEAGVPLRERHNRELLHLVYGRVDEKLRGPAAITMGIARTSI
jgi:hypothetical protein